MVTRLTASKELLAKYEDPKERRQEGLTSQEAYEMGRIWRCYDALRSKLISDKDIELTYRPTTQEVALACGKFRTGLEAFLNSRQTPDLDVFNEYRVVPFVEDALNNFVADYGVYFFKADYYFLLAEFFSALPRDLGYDQVANESRKVMLMIALAAARSEPILEDVETGEKLSLNEMFRRFPAREPEPVDAEEKHRKSEWQPGRYQASGYQIVFEYYLNGIWTTSRYGVGSTELEASSAFYERARREHTLYRLDVERRIAKSALDLGTDQTPESIIEAAIERLKLLIANRISRMKSLQEINAPGIILQHEKEMLECVKYTLQVVKRNRAWLIDFLSK